MKKIVALLVLSLTLFSCNKQETTSFMSFNIRYDNKNDKENWWGYRKNDVVAQIEDYHPDFLGIQEGLHHQIQFLDKQLPSYQFTGSGRDDGAQKGEYAAIFYKTQKFQLLESSIFWLSTTPDTVSIGWDAALPRIATYGHFIDKSSKEHIHIFNTHFDHLGVLAREKSAKLILQKIIDLELEKEKLVVMGDLNALPEETPVTVLKGLLKDSFNLTSSKLDSAGTFNGFKKDSISEKRIDYIFTLNLDVKHYENIDKKRPNGLWVSDHMAVFIETTKRK